MIVVFWKNLQNQKNWLKKKKALTLKNIIILPNGRQELLNAFESGIFPKGKQGMGLTSILDCVSCIPQVAIVSDCKVCDHKQLKILTNKIIVSKITKKCITIWIQ